MNERFDVMLNSWVFHDVCRALSDRMMRFDGHLDFAL